MIKVRPESNKTMSLVRGTNLSEQYISLLQSSAEHHGLLIVNIVIRGSMHHQIFFILQFFGHGGDVTGLITNQVVVGCWKSKVSGIGMLSLNQSIQIN